MVSREGGVEIEKVAEETPEKILTLPIDPDQGVTEADCEKLCDALGLEGEARVDHQLRHPKKTQVGNTEPFPLRTRVRVVMGVRSRLVKAGQHSGAAAQTPLQVGAQPLVADVRGVVGIVVDPGGRAVGDQHVGARQLAGQLRRLLL